VGFVLAKNPPQRIRGVFKSRGFLSEYDWDNPVFLKAGKLTSQALSLEFFLLTAPMNLRVIENETDPEF